MCMCVSVSECVCVCVCVCIHIHIYEMGLPLLELTDIQRVYTIFSGIYVDKDLNIVYCI